MPPNSITLDFKKMPTVTVDGKTHKFQTDKANGGFKSITEGGVTYSLVKDVKDRFHMTITGEPAALEKFNFGVGKGRVTDANFGSDSMKSFFKGFVGVGDQKKAEKDYFKSFSIGGAHLADRTAFLQSGAWGMDQSAALDELNRLEDEATKKAEEDTSSKTQPSGSASANTNPVGTSQKDSVSQNTAQIVKGADKEGAKIQNPPQAGDSPINGLVVNKSAQEKTFLSREILKDQAGELYDKVLAASGKKPELKDNPDFKRLVKNIHRYAEGSSLESLKFAKTETEKLFLSSAHEYLQGLDGDIDAFSNPKDPSLDLIEQYPTQFQAAWEALKTEKSLSLTDHDLQSLSPSEILVKLQPDEKTNVLKLFNDFVNEANEASVDPSNSNSQSATQKSADLLKSLDLKRVQVPDDGNCLFFSISANDDPDSEVSSFSKSPREANTARDNLLETFEQLTPEKAQKSFSGRELFKTWDALQSGLLTVEQIRNAEKNGKNPSIDSSSWGTSSHLRLNAIRTGRPQVAIDAASNKIYVYHPSGNSKSVDASDVNAKSDLHEFTQKLAAQIYESLPGHWNAVQVPKE